MIQYIFVLCAPPGAGKTTFSHRLAEQYNAVRYSFDEMKCFKHSDLIESIIKSINKGKSVVVDALYSKVRFREELLQSISNTDCKKICVCFRISLEECINRNAKRSGRERLPDFVVEDIYHTFELPTLDEGWDEILYFK